VRIAWIGPMPSREGGASGVSNLLLSELDTRQVEVDCYVPGNEEALPKNLLELKHVRFFCGPSAWSWDRWYSRNRLLGFITGQMANLRSENRLTKVLLRNHQRKPYDVVYQFSHIEFSALRHMRSKLPPIVLHPSVHAKGELRSLRTEAHLSKMTEPFIMRIGARALLTARSYVQKRHIRYADIVFGLSENFGRDLNRDYGVSLELMPIVPNPVDLLKFRPVNRVTVRDGRMPVLFVSRISVRKGVEMVVELSHRLADLAEKIEILVVGDRTMWSDYTKLLSNLNPSVARYIGAIDGSSGEMQQLYQTAGLLIQPSHYEPFGLTVAESLASGVPVVASNKVGAAENVSALACRTYEDGEMEGLECTVRQLIVDVLDDTRAQTIRQAAREEAERLFSVQSIATKLLEGLHQASLVQHRVMTNKAIGSLHAEPSERA
jgi:glycosyltransferase involved in cell wall biosynthesis